MFAEIVIGSSFGDEGKGLTTNWLCIQRNFNANKIVVRFSGGQQAGHTVINNGVKHVHSSYGSGTMNGIETYLTEDCTLYPNYIFRETVKLKEKGVNPPKIIANPFTKVTTPADIAYGRIMETKKNHGSCGMGVGATMHRNNTTGYKLYAFDINYPELFLAKVNNISKYYQSLLSPMDKIFFLEIEEQEMKLFAETYSTSFKVEDYDYLYRYNELIFEGSQGILLDMDHGIFPNVTYASTTSKNALKICKKLKIKNIEIFYVTRCYQTRHGNGWMSNESPIDLVNNQEEINVENPYQGKFRTGELDYRLLNHAIGIDLLYSQKYKHSLVMTCLDQRPKPMLKSGLIHSKIESVYLSASPESKYISKVLI